MAHEENPARRRANGASIVNCLEVGILGEEVVVFGVQWMVKGNEGKRDFKRIWPTCYLSGRRSRSMSASSRIIYLPLEFTK